MRAPNYTRRPSDRGPAWADGSGSRAHRQLGLDRSNDELAELTVGHPGKVFVTRVQVEGGDDVNQPRPVQRAKLLTKLVQVASADLKGIQHRLGPRSHSSRHDWVATFRRVEHRNFDRTDADGNWPARALERALEEDRGEPGRPVLEMRAFRLCRFDAGHQHLRAPVYGRELNPSFPHPAVPKATDGAGMVFAKLVPYGLIEGDQNFSHVTATPAWLMCNRGAASPSQQNVTSHR